MSEPDLATDRGPIALFARNPIAANLLMVLLLGGGLIAAFNLSLQGVPDYEPPMVYVTVAYPGSTPTEVDEEIIRRIVEAVLDVDGVKDVYSEARDGLAVVTAVLETFADLEHVVDDIKTEVNALRNFPPPLADPVSVDIPRMPRNVASLAIASRTATEFDLRRAAELLREELLALPTVSIVSIYGARDYEVSIEVSEESLRRHDLTIEQVANIVGQSSVNLSSGELRSDAGAFSVRTNTKRWRGEEFRNIVVLSREDGTLVYLDDVAEIRDAFEDVELVSELDGDPAVFLIVRQSSVGDPRIVETAEAVLATAAEFELPQGMKLIVWDDSSEAVVKPLNAIIGTAMVGLALVFLFLVGVFDLRFTIWVTLGIPVSFLGAFVLFDSFGVNFNASTLLALFVVIGIVVDDAVVVGESIVTMREQRGPGIAAAVSGARDVRDPVLVGVLTTMIAFAPLLFLPGLLGQVMGDFPIVVILVLAVSLVEAFLILPAHLRHGGAWSLPPLSNIESRVGSWLTELRDQYVVRAVSAAIRRPWRVVGVSAAILILPAMLLVGGGVDFVFFQPLRDVDRMQVDVSFPAGTPFETTRSAADTIVAAADAMGEQMDGRPIRSVAVIAGAQPVVVQRGYSRDHGTFAPNVASVTVRFNEDALNTFSLGELERLLRSNVGNIQGAERIDYYAASYETPFEIDFFLKHPDPGVLTEAAADLERTFEQTPGLFGIRNSTAPGKRQYEIELNATGVALGLSPAAVAGELRNKFLGAEVHRLQRGRDELGVVVRYPPDRMRSLADLLDEQVSRGDGTRVPLALVADVVETEGPGAVTRFDGQLAARVRARLDPKVTTSGEVTAHLEQEILPVLEARFPGLSLSKAGQYNLQETFAEVLYLLVPIALLLIYGLIAVQLRSYVQPLLVLASIPFGVAGAVLGHFVLGYELSAVSVIGIVAAAGVVINDTLVLLDRYNRIDPDGEMPAVAVAAAAARHRFRAIFLTTATTLFGLLPMLYLTDDFAGYMIPLVISLMGGLVVASVAVLFIVPTLLLVLETRAERLSGRPSESPA